MPHTRTPAGFDEYAGDRDFATTLARGLELLRCFSPGEQWLGNRQLAERLSLPAATISRLTYTLTQMGYLVQEGPHGRYRLGSAVLSLGYPLLEYFPIRRKARPLMQQLAKDCGGSVSIGIRDRLNVVYIEVVRTHARRVYPLDVGTSYPILGTAIGRAYLMAQDVEARESIMNQVRVKAPAQWERFGRSVIRSIKHYERWQCCTSVGELFADVQAVAVPMGPIDNGEWAALNCSFQGRELNETWLRTEIAPKLHEIARRILD